MLSPTRTYKISTDLAVVVLPTDFTTNLKILYARARGKCYRFKAVNVDSYCIIN